MSRQPKLALGLAALALIAAVGAAPRPSAAVAQSSAAKAEARGAARHESEGVLDDEHPFAGYEDPGEPDILEFQPTLAIWTVVVFVGLLVVLRAFAWKPLLASLHQREEHLEHVLLETERARNEGEQLLQEHRRRLAAAEEQVRALIDEARRNAAALSEEMIKKAQGEADSARERAEREIASARDQALSEIWSKTADLAVSVAGKVLGKSLTEDDHRRLIDAAVGELPAARPSTNGHGGARA